MTGHLVTIFLAVICVIFALPMPYEDVRAIKLALTEVEWSLKGNSQANVENAVQTFKAEGERSCGQSGGQL